MPSLPGGYRRSLPLRRPPGLASRTVPAGVELWRVEAAAPADWTWNGFPQPRFRFDPVSGAFRTRYAATASEGAFRERYRDTGRTIPADHASQYLIRLVSTRPLRIFDLRTQRNLDALDVDDQISTGQRARVWRQCHHLADAARRWWPDIDAIVYRSRTTPETSVNYAFFGLDAFAAESWELGSRTDVLVDLVLRHDFTVNWEI
ncbi:RES domain-containing protein [Mycobacterium paragordonae]|uniref:RES family NAD+ phosphorylase n=1 Tax=Mycobacterium paragordonae TaxID=1389713 RepID=UPI00105F115B|nr:RES family NAD+ phosphorylase [Mycobacterium paragordonae]TDK99019.1 RES domain-containing protein [Mycobacterium paragordonae]